MADLKTAVEKKIPAREATNALILQAVLALPFFFVGPIIETGVGLIATKVVPKIAAQANGVAAQTINTALAAKIAAGGRRLGEKILETGKKPLAEAFAVGTNRQYARLLYLEQSIVGLDNWVEALTAEIEGCSDVGALAVIFGALIAQDRGSFAHGFDSSFSDWSEKTLPALQKTARDAAAKQASEDAKNYPTSIM